MLVTSPKPSTTESVEKLEIALPEPSGEKSCLILIEHDAVTILETIHPQNVICQHKKTNR